MTPDAELLDRWRAGETAAGEELVARYWASVARFFRSKIGDDGADLISQTFLACVESRAQIDNLKAYLFATARRRLADHFRRAARSRELDFSVTSVADLAPGAATELSRMRRGNLLREAMIRIPLDDQIALELAYVEELSSREIAEVLELGENTVRSRLSRAKDKLRAALAELAGSPSEAAEAESQLVKSAT